jgi:hypothetical protein
VLIELGGHSMHPKFLHHPKFLQCIANDAKVFIKDNMKLGTDMGHGGIINEWYMNGVV